MLKEERANLISENEELYGKVKKNNFEAFLYLGYVVKDMLELSNGVQFQVKC